MMNLDFNEGVSRIILLIWLYFPTFNLLNTFKFYKLFKRFNKSTWIIFLQDLEFYALLALALVNRELYNGFVGYYLDQWCKNNGESDINISTLMKLKKFIFDETSFVEHKSKNHSGIKSFINKICVIPILKRGNAWRKCRLILIKKQRSKIKVSLMVFWHSLLNFNLWIWHATFIVCTSTLKKQTKLWTYKMIKWVDVTIYSWN